MTGKLMQLADLLCDPGLTTSCNDFFRIADNDKTVLFHHKSYINPQWFHVLCNGKTYILDKNMLRRNSHYFDALFNFEDTDTLDLELASSASFELLAQFMLGALDIMRIPEGDILPLLLAADYLQMPYLIEICLRNLLAKPGKYYPYVLAKLEEPLEVRWFEAILDQLASIETKLQWMEAVVYNERFPWTDEQDEYLEDVITTRIIPLEQHLQLQTLSAILPLRICERLPLKMLRHVPFPNKEGPPTIVFARNYETYLTDDEIDVCSIGPN